jgi:outer membrane receptor protein involved in Fe transport
MQTPKILLLLIYLCLSLTAPVCRAGALSQQAPTKLRLTVLDENGIPVVSAQVSLVRTDTQAVLKAETDYAGRCELADLTPGLYQLRVEKAGFYATRLDGLRVGETERVELTLNHEQEVRSEVNVAYSPPAIDPAKTTASEELNSRAIVNLPYPTTRDFRNVLPFIPGVVRDPTGQVHINGSATRQILDQLDGFNITQPASGLLELRVSPDALRSIEVLGSRYSAEYGKSSGGVVQLTTGMGDERLRFSATDFIPSFQTRRGLNVNGWTPRATFSGPLYRRAAAQSSASQQPRSKAWFFDAVDGDFNLDIIEELPAGADRNRAWRLNNLAKALVSVSPHNILTVGLLNNYFHADHAGLSQLNPIETTRGLKQTASLLTLKDQTFFPSGLLLELGFAFNRFRARGQPLGDAPFVINLESRSGSYFKASESDARRWQGIANLTLPVRAMAGRHEFKLGTDINLITYTEYDERRTIFIRRGDGTLAREIRFTNFPRFHRNNYELGGFAQDRWSVSERWLLELGLRFDRDEIVRRTLVSPRLASSYLLTHNGETKLAAGVGLFYDATNLDFIARPLAGRRMDFFYTRDGRTLAREPVETVFQFAGRNLRAPRFINWSLGLERKLPLAFYLSAELISRRGSRGLAYDNLDAAELSAGHFELHNGRRDTYRAAQFTLRRSFKEGYSLLVSYTRSAARSNRVLDFNLDNTLFGQRTGGPLAWDTPNRLLSWGWLPLVKRFDLAYSLEWRTGYPFSLVNQEQQLVESVNSQRFPAYFSLNLHAERRFELFGLNWALRAGFNNLTDRPNPSEVVNNVDSPQFLTYGGVQRRVFVGRIRFLGRK